jgi:hypothetical protein
MQFLAELWAASADADHRLIEEARCNDLVRCTGIVYVPGDETCFLVYEAESAEAVVLAGEEAGVRFTRVVAAQSSVPEGSLGRPCRTPS